MSDLWQQATSFAALRRAAYRAAQGKYSASSTCQFMYKLESEVLRLQQELHGGHWRPAGYRSFVLRDPKPRVISAAPFRDRVVHHALCTVLEPLWEEAAIEHSYACREGKGHHAALKTAHRASRAHRWVLKMDIARYFETVSHKVLLEQLCLDPRDYTSLKISHRLSA